MFMQSSRDSSVWRSLAVAFGDGVAFGVGVKLSQRAATLGGAATPQAPETVEPLSGRLELLEQRLARIEKSKALPPAPFDQKVLEAVVNALDARLKEQAATVERRITELEARLATEVKGLRQQDQAIVTALEPQITALEARLATELKELRQQDQAMAAAVETHLERLQDHFIAQVDTVRQQVERDRAAMSEEVAAAVRAASESLVEERLAPIRAESAGKDREIAALHKRLEDNDQAMLDLLNGMGDVIRHAAERRAAAAAPPAAPAAEPVPASPTAPPNPATEPDTETPPPSFTQAAQPGRLWRVPLVSSIAIATFGMAMIHYL